MATLGIIVPSLIIIIIIAYSFMHFQDNQIVQHAFAGIRVAVSVLVLNAVVRMWKTTVKDYIGVIIFVISFLLIAFTDISPIIIIIATAAAGILLSYRKAVDK